MPGINQVSFWKLLIRDDGFFSVLFLVMLNLWTVNLPVKFFISISLIQLFLPGVTMIPILSKIKVLSSALPPELKGPCGLLGTTDDNHETTIEILQSTRKQVVEGHICYNIFPSFF